MPNQKTIILLFLFTFPYFSTAQDPLLLDSLKKVLPTLEGESKVQTLLKICNEIKFQDADAARTYCQEALAVSQNLKLEKWEGVALQRIGVTYEGQGEFDKALDYGEKALVIFQKLNDSLEIANSYNNIGIVFDQKGQNEKALLQLFDALKYYEALGDKGGIAQSANNIGIVYKKEKNYPKVIEYYKRSLTIYEEIKHEFGIAATEVNIGSVYLDMKNYQATIEYSEKALKGFEKLNIQQYIPYALENLGLAHKNLGNFELAKNYHEDALKLYEKYDNKKESAFTMNSLADIFLKTEKIQQAENFAKRSLQRAEEIEAQEEIRNANLTLSEIYEIKGEFFNAYKHHKTFTEIKDTLFEIEKTERIAELNTRYETEKKEKENLQLKSENEIQTLAISKKQSQLIGLGLGTLLLLLIGALLFNRRNLKEKTKLAEQELAFQEQTTQLTIEAQEKERKRISKDLHDGIGQQLSGLKMAWSQLASKVKNTSETDAATLNKLTNVLDDAANDVRNISHQMMPRALEEFGLVSAIDDMLETSFSSSKITHEFEHFGIKNRFPEKIEIGLYRIAQELINNILKHSKASEVGVQLFQNKKNLVLVVEDNGSGFDLEKNKPGHGIANINYRSRAIGGTVNVESAIGNGTLVTVRIAL
ncbi:MAG: tetratricopeptide repeat protein [Saprospiraceae bacterium]